jgi:hypothetical protein
MLRQQYHGIFSTPVDFELASHAQTFINGIMDEGFFCIDKNGQLSGDIKCLPRLILDNVLEQAMFDRRVFCPLVALSIVCQERSHFCTEELVQLTQTLKAAQHRCALSVLLNIVEV